MTELCSCGPTGDRNSIPMTPTAPRTPALAPRVTPATHPRYPSVIKHVKDPQQAYFEKMMKDAGAGLNMDEPVEVDADGGDASGEHEEL